MPELQLKLTVEHAPATTDQMIAWLEDPDATLGMNLRTEIAQRLRDLRFTPLQPRKSA